MFYKPNYCCNCGEKIERIEWNLFTNRRFCGVCESEHQLDDWLKRIVPTIFLLIGIFGIGSYFQGSSSPVDITESDKKTVLPKSVEKQTAKPRALKSSNSEPIQTLNNKREKNASRSQTETKTQAVALEKKEQPNDEVERVLKVKSPKKDSNGTVYFCGAKTKKGTPCSRKVKGGGRCWQHEGREAILSEKELFIDSK